MKKLADRTSGNRWRKDELELLEQLINQRATQLQISAALPVRSCEAIRKKLLHFREKGVIVLESEYHDPATIRDQLARKFHL